MWPSAHGLHGEPLKHSAVRTQLIHTRFESRYRRYWVWWAIGTITSQFQRQTQEDPNGKIPLFRVFYEKALESNKYLQFSCRIATVHWWGTNIGFVSARALGALKILGLSKVEICLTSTRASCRDRICAHFWGHRNAPQKVKKQDLLCTGALEKKNAENIPRAPLQTLARATTNLRMFVKEDLRQRRDARACVVQNATVREDDNKNKPICAWKTTAKQVFSHPYLDIPSYIVLTTGKLRQISIN